MHACTPNAQAVLAELTYDYKHVMRLTVTQILLSIRIFHILLSSLCLQRVLMILYVKKDLRYDIQVLQSPLKLSPFTQTSSVFLCFFFACVYQFARNMSVCCVTLNVLFTTVFFHRIRSFIAVSLFLTARVVLYGGCDILIIYSRHWGGVYHEGVAIWQRCWTSVHDVTFCYVCFLDVFYGLLCVFVIISFCMLFFFCDERAAFAHVSLHQEYVHIQDNIMLRLFSAKRVTCSLYTHHGLLQLILFTGKFPTCSVDFRRARNLETYAGLGCIGRCYFKAT